MAARASQDVVEVAYPRITYTPTTVTGAGVSQDVIEVAYGYVGAARVSQDVIEVAFGYAASGSGGSVPGTGTPSGGTTSFGYAV